MFKNNYKPIFSDQDFLIDVTDLIQPLTTFKFKINSAVKFWIFECVIDEYFTEDSSLWELTIDSTILEKFFETKLSSWSTSI